MLLNIVLLILGVVFISSGIFKWYFILAFFTWRFKPENDFDILILRIGAIIIGILFVIGSLRI